MQTKNDIIPNRKRSISVYNTNYKKRIHYKGFESFLLSTKHTRLLI